MPQVPHDRIPQRFMDRRRPQKAEKLVEVPTVVSYSSLQQTAEQNVYIQFLALVVIMEVFKVLSQSRAELNVDISVPGGGLHDPLPASGASSAGSRDEPGQGVFRTLPVGKRCVGRQESECEGARALELMDSGGSCGIHRFR